MIKVFRVEGYLACIRHNDMGFLCGYMYIPKGHTHQHDEHESLWNVHGGITFESDKLKDVDETNEGLGGTWIGFDCAHLGDARDPEFVLADPRMDMRTFERSSFKDEDYVRNELYSLASQLGPYKPNRYVPEPNTVLDLPL